MSFSEKLNKASVPKKDPVDRLNDYIHSLENDERDALLELLKNYPSRVAHDALHEEGYAINREGVLNWKRRYGV